MLRLIITGTGGPLADPKRFGPSQIILIDDKKLAFDRGYGFVRQLVNLGIRPSEVDHLFITHMHYDHVCDLPSLLFTAWHETPRKRLQIYGPEGIKELHTEWD